MKAIDKTSYQLCMIIPTNRQASSYAMKDNHSLIKHNPLMSTYLSTMQGFGHDLFMQEFSTLCPSM